MTQQSTPYDIPKELTYEAITTFCPSTKVEVRQTPTNGTAPIAPGTVLNLLIGQKQRSFMNPATLVLKFLVTYNINASPGPVTSYVLGGGYGHFRDITIKSLQGEYNESIQNHNVLTNLIYSATVNSADKCAMINLGYDDSQGLNTSHIGLIIPAATTASTQYRSYTLPILSSLNTDKLIPLDCGDISIDLMINSLSNFIVAAGNSNTPISNFTISDIELVYDTIEIADPYYSQLIAAHGNLLTIKTNFYQYGSTFSLPVGTSGYQELPMNHKVNSLKQIIWSCVPSDAWEQEYSGVNPNLTDWSLVINGNQYPQKAVPVRYVSEAYYQNSKSFGSVYSSLHSGNCRRVTFSKACISAGDVTNATNIATREYSPYSITSSNDAQLTAYNNSVSNKFYQILDLEKINQLKTGSYSGLSTMGGQNVIRLNIGKALSSSVSTNTATTFKINYWTISDCTLMFDMTNHQILMKK